MKISLFILLTVLPLGAAEPLTLKLWPNGAPGQMLPRSKATDDFIRTKAGKSTITDISDPTIEVYRPEKPNGTSVIVAPGGAYAFLSAVHEGTQVCEWLNTLGVTAILLKYRTPTRDEAAPHEKPVQDAAKAIALVRKHSKEWQLNPTRVGLLGFSAGGNLLAHLACDRDWSRYPANADQIKLSLPSFGIMIYGGGFLDPNGSMKLKDGFTVSADAPPMFLACAHDDGQNPVAATLRYLEYQKQNIPAELHLFTKGGHGFGMRDNKQPINAWPQRCAEWMESMGWMPNLTIINREIEKYQQAIEGLGKRLTPRGLTFICGNEYLKLKEIENLIQDAKANGEVEKERRYQKMHKNLSDALSKSLEEQQSLDPHEYLEKLEQLQKDMLEREVERDRLLQNRSK